MKTVNFSLTSTCGLLALILAALWWPTRSDAALEQTFDVLQVGTTTYHKVTVTTKSKSYVFLLHSKGMTTIKVADLSPELLVKLGYQDPAPTRAATNSPAVWAKAALSKLDAPEVQKLRAQAISWAPAREAIDKLHLDSLNRNALLIAGAVLLGLYLFSSYCYKLICEKCGCPPGVLIWLPLLRFLPLLKAAAMSRWWFVGLLLPGLNLVALVLWFIKIVQARGKGMAAFLGLLIPVTTPFAVLYLAFSKAKPETRTAPRRVPIMSLEAA